MHFIHTCVVKGKKMKMIKKAFSECPQATARCLEWTFVCYFLSRKEKFVWVASMHAEVLFKGFEGNFFYDKFKVLDKKSFFKPSRTLFPFKLSLKLQKFIKFLLFSLLNCSFNQYWVSKLPTCLLLIISSTQEIFSSGINQINSSPAIKT